MNNIIMDTNSETASAAKEKEIKIMEAAKSNAAATTEVAATTESSVAETATGTDAAVAAEAADTAATEKMVTDEAVEVGSTDTAVIGNADTGMAVNEGVAIDGGMTGDLGMGEGMYTDPMMETGMAQPKDPLLSSWPFVIGISAAVLFVSVAFGVLLARRKIKKGIELYED
jgi:hypothetical protein